MAEFFHLRRRKVGCVTLLVALLFCGMSVRSQWVADSLVLDRDKGGRYYLTSNRDGLTWGRRWGSGQRVHLPQLMNIGWESNYEDNSQFEETGSGWPVDWKLQCCGFQFAKFLLTSETPADCWSWKFCGVPIASYTVRSDPPHREPNSPGELSLVYGGLSIWTIPFWFLTLPMTVISFLLLTNPAKTIRARSA